MNYPKISIITINYNNVDGLKKTINSVKEQTYQDIEFIIIDGLSNDGSKTLLEKETKNISLWLSEKDSGIFNAMNKGITQATGDYLLFLNSGDVFTSATVLNSFVNHSKFKGDIIYGDYKFEKGEKEYPNQLTPEFFMRSSLPHQSTLISKRTFQTIGNYDENYKIIGDREHFFRAYLSRKLQFSHIPIALSLFDLSGKSNAKEYKSLKQEEDEHMFKKHFGLFYEDYLEFFKLKKALSIAKGQTINGVFNRAIKKIKRLF
ncbi:MAG: glycosyltransferase [Winogradskyella sp.]|uniref:glycosyltransferase family 2 protein n=1 Tax=Winogradskyella sp. TaxID=1883156 RepID=UPI0025DF79D3|nr:glycosyltransferase family 2 protein [Winogradskyella sp.]NRB59414.1 glycosyltransferase [Winogradskyella sp.]